MKIEIFRNYLEAGLKRVSAALDTAHEVGSLIGIKVSKDALFLSVVTENLSCQVKLDAKSDKENILKIVKDGELSVNGKMFIDAIDSLDGRANLVIEYDPDAKVEPVEGEEQTSGLLRIKAERGNKTEEVSLARIDRKISVSLPEPSPRVVVKGGVFSDYYKKVGISAGKANMAAEFANVNLQASDGKMSMVTTNAQQLSRAWFDADVKKPLSVFLPYEILLKAVNMFGDEDVSIQVSDGKPICGILSQPLVFLEKNNGEARYKVGSICDTFPNYKRVLDKLNWIATCQINKKEMEQVIKSFDIFEQVRTRMEVSKSGEIGLRKLTDKGKAVRWVTASELSFVKPEDAQDIEMDISSRHLSLAISTATKEDVMVKLSGKSSMALMELGDGLEFYFQPFK